MSLEVEKIAERQFRILEIKDAAEGLAWDDRYTEFSGFSGAYGPHVFAAAPEMLAALKKIAAMETPYANATVRRITTAARAAIAKAEGRE